MAVVVEMRNHTVVVVVQQGEHMLEGLASKRGYDGFSC